MKEARRFLRDSHRKGLPQIFRTGPSQT